MIRIINNLSISLRVALLCILPLVALLVVGVNELLSQNSKTSDAHIVSEIVKLTPAISELVHELQKERGISAGFLSSKGKIFANKISQERSKTDKVYLTFQKDLEKVKDLTEYSAFAEPYKRSIEAINKLNQIRSSVDAFSIKLPQMSGHYTKLISDLLAMVESVSFQINDVQTIRSLKAYTALLHAKEYAGLERAMGASGFGSGKFTPVVHEKFIRFDARQNTFLKESHSYSNKDGQAKLKAALSGSEKQALDKLKKKAIGAPHGSDISGITGSQWFETSTRMINVLKGIENSFIKGILLDVEEKRGAAAFSFWLVAIALLVLLVITGVFSFLVIRSIVPPLQDLISDMKRLADNDISIEVTGSTRMDEIGDMAKTVVVFRESAKERERLERSSNEESLLREQRQKTIEELITEFRAQSRQSIEAFSTNAQHMQGLANTLDGIASATSQQTESTTVVTGQASDSVRSVATATEEMTASIAEISHQVTKTNNLVTDATRDAEQSNSKISNLAEAAEKIGSVVALIQDIAEQTNLLALNATIEAARAGEAGKGFAVVASEVKGLASQTAKATEEISDQVSGIQSETNDTVQAIQAIALKMADVSKYTTSISASIEQQGSAISEIANNIHEVSGSTDEVVNNINSVAGSVQETKSSVAQVVDASSNVLKEADSMTQVIDSFLKNVSSA